MFLVRIILISVILYLRNVEGVCQTNSNSKTLLKMLKADSAFLYEVKSNWGDGISNFIAYRDNKIISGYFINSKLLYKELSGRKLISVDSANWLDKVIYSNSISDIQLWRNINKKVNFDMQLNGKVNSKCVAINSDDGEITVISKYIKLYKVYSAKYYQIDEMLQCCPDDLHLKNFKILISIFKKRFPEDLQILKTHIGLYKRKSKPINK